jgi:hypothetical protein
MTALLLIHAAATLYMTGLIWFVQAVHYPLFGRVGPAGYADYQKAHMDRTAWVTAPPMLVEAAASALLAWLARRDPAAAGLSPSAVAAVWLGLALTAGLWVSTFGFQVPEHGRLAKGYDTASHRRLVAGNWFRTAAWTARGGLALYLIAERMS